MATIAPVKVRSGRNTELVLLIPALIVGIGGYALAGLGYKEEVPANIYGYSAALIALALVFHLVLRFKAKYADPVMLPIVVALTGIGMAMIYRLDLPAEATAAANNSTYTSFAPRQLLWDVVGVVCAIAIILFLKDHRTLRRFTYIAMIASLALLALPMLPGIGQTKFGASIWIQVGPMSLQPAELAKIGLAIFFAGYLVTNRDTLALAGKTFLGLQLPRLRDLGPILVVWAVSLGLLIFERDLGTSLLFFGMFVAMLYIATERWSWILIGLVLFAGGAAIVALKIPHVTDRFSIWIHALDAGAWDKSYQLVQGLFGLANGGLFGTGWGDGRPDLVPFSQSDFIFASLGEELGITGLLAILMLYVILVERGMRTALGLRDGFGKLLAGGLAFTIAFQCFIVVGGITRVIPLTGLTLPFLAYGGSSLLANWMIVALLLRMSDAARRPGDVGEEPPRKGKGDGESKVETTSEQEPVIPADLEMTQVVKLP